MGMGHWEWDGNKTRVQTKICGKSGVENGELCNAVQREEGIKKCKNGIIDDPRFSSIRSII